MARDGSGNYSLPAGNPVVTGTSISSTVQNNTMSDVAAALTQSVSKDGQTAMTGTLNMGNNAITNGAAITGTVITATSLISPTLVASGNVTAAGFIPTSATVLSNGMYLSAANTLAWSTNSTLRQTVNATGNWNTTAPTAGISFTINGFSGSAALALIATATGTIQSYTDGTRTATLATVAGGYELAVTSAHSLAFRANNTVFFTIASAGNITTVAPTSGVGLTVAGLSGARPLVVNGAGSTSASASQIYEPLFGIAATTLACTYETGSFTGTLTGCATSPTATFNYSRVGSTVTIDCSAGLTATSNTTACTVTGLPAALTPARTQVTASFAIADAGVGNNGGAISIAGTTLTLQLGLVAATKFQAAATNFTNSGTKGVSPGMVFTYNLT